MGHQQETRTTGDIKVKCRWCAKGYSQHIKDPDTETYSSAPSSMTLYILLIISHFMRWSSWASDISSAFLWTPVQGDIR
eukprot:3596082-Amphidinium_carterae.1